MRHSAASKHIHNTSIHTQRDRQTNYSNNNYICDQYQGHFLFLPGKHPGERGWLKRNSLRKSQKWAIWLVSYRFIILLMNFLFLEHILGGIHVEQFNWPVGSSYSKNLIYSFNQPEGPKCRIETLPGLITSEPYPLPHTRDFLAQKLISLCASNCIKV